MFWLVRQIAHRAPGRLLLGAMAAAIPVATLASAALFIADSTSAMTAVTLEHVQVEYRALATTLNVDIGKVASKLQSAQGVRAVDVFAAANVVVTAPGASNRVSCPVDRSCGRELQTSQLGSTSRSMIMVRPSAAAAAAKGRPGWRRSRPRPAR
jgi:hypothetical protein